MGVMDHVEVDLLTGPGALVLRMPGRQFPGVLIQGDSLSVLFSQARELASGLTGAKSAAAEDASLLAAALGELLDDYAVTLEQHDIPLPYVP